MARLRRSPSGYTRSLQMSRHELWILVEGAIDKAFYGSICLRSDTLQGVDYHIAISKEIANSDGEGKEELLRYYRRLRASKQLGSVDVG